MFTSTGDFVLAPKRSFALTLAAGVVTMSLVMAGGNTACGQEQAKTSGQIERFIPGDAILAVSTNDAAAAARQFLVTPLGAMLQTKSWEPYFAAVNESHLPSALHLKPLFGIDWQDLAQFPVPAGICLLAGAKNNPGWAIFVDVRDRPEAAKAIPQRAADYFRGRKAQVTEAEDKVVFTLPAGGKSVEEVVCLKHEGLVALVTSREIADRLAELWKSKEYTSLADAAAYRSLQEQADTLLKAPADVRWWLRPLELIRALPAPPAKAERGRRDWRTSAEKLGIGGVQAIGGTICLARSEPARIEAALAVLAPRPFDRALRLVSLQPGEWRDPPPWAEADAASWSLSYRDVKLVFEGFGTAFDVKAGPDNEGSFRDYIDRLQEDADGPQVSIRREVLPRFKPSLVRLSDFGGPRPAWNPSGRRDLMLLETKEAADLEKVFRRWFATDVKDERVRLQMVRGHSLWAAEPGRNLFLNFKEEQERTITSLAIIDDKLLLSSDETWLRSILEVKEPKAPLSKDARFAAAASYLKSRQSPQTALRSYSRSAALWQSPYERLQGGKSGEDDEASQKLLALLLFGRSEDVPPNLPGALPRYSDVSSSLGTWAVSIGVSPEGFAGTIGILAEKPPNAGGADGNR